VEIVSEQSIPSEPPTVFIVDDDGAMRDSLTWLLQSHGLVTEAYSTAEAFLDTYAPDRPGCLIIDVLLPGMSGLDLVDELARRGITLQVIVITAHGDPASRRRVFKTGALDYMEKPFNADTLLAGIQRAMEMDREARLVAYAGKPQPESDKT
jgi:FixJ family two-component response regulator